MSLAPEIILPIYLCIVFRREKEGGNGGGDVVELWGGRGKLESAYRKNFFCDHRTEMPKACIYAGFQHLFYQMALVWLYLWEE